jgi:phenylacetate-coenzyme A ligase PaaK-like adenylate-forming protein
MTQAQRYSSDILAQLSSLIRHFSQRDKSYKDIRLPLCSVDDLRAIPVISKENLVGYPARDVFNITATSGSTASRLLIAHSRLCHETHIHRLVTLYKSIGVSPRDLCLNLCSYRLNSGGRLMELAYKGAGAGVIPFGALDGEGRVKEAVELVRIFKPTVVNSYINQLFDLFSVLGKKHSIRACVVNGEPLSPNFRTMIETMGGAKVYNHYGAMEVSGFAVAQKHTDAYMKIFDEGLLVEILKDDGTIVRDGIGAILLTDLLNTSMPFIRYKLGDRVDIRERKNGAYVRVLGRLHDTILIDGEVHDAARIVQAAQEAIGHPNFFLLVQKDPQTYKDSVTVNLPNRDSAHFRRIEAALRVRIPVGSRLRAFRYQGVFPKTTTGKYRQMIDARKEFTAH